MEKKLETTKQQEAVPKASVKREDNKGKVRKLTLAAMLTAVVIVLQLLGSAIHVGIFSINLALVPIVIGAAMLGFPCGAWLGFVNALVILLSGDAGPFLAVNPFGTVITVIVKGVMAGLCSGLVYKLLEHWNKYAAVILAAVVCPVVNTGIFLIGCRIFFWPTITEWAQASGFENAGAYAILGLAGVNFLAELAINIILAPAIARILGFSQDKNTARIVYGCLLGAVGFGFLIFAFVLLGTKGEGSLFARYRISQGLNPTQRYALLALFSDVCRLAGVVLIAIGVYGKRRAAKLDK